MSRWCGGATGGSPAAAERWGDVTPPDDIMLTGSATTSPTGGTKAGCMCLFEPDFIMFTSSPASKSKVTEVNQQEAC